MIQEDVEAFFRQRGVDFETREIEHATQVRAKKTGEAVNFFHTGKVVVQGKNTHLKQELVAMSQTGMVPASPSPESDVNTSPSTLNKNVFIVYGHDITARNDLELLLHRMRLNPIVLASLPAAGDTIIEKLEKYLRDANGVGFGCVLLTPDDQGHRQGAPEEIKHRARQNVILELGMVLSRLGRQRVAILYKHSVEKPSDIDGLIYLPFKEKVEEVKAALFKELQAAGYTPDTAAL